MLLEGLLKYFSKIEKRLIENILWVVEAMMRSCTANTSQIALVLSQLKKTSFKASDMAIYRLLSNSRFEKGQVWFIVTKLVEMEQQEGIEIYTTRFCIEFQNLKSSGFDLEETKIKKYSRFKRLFFVLSSIQLFSVVR